MEDDPKMLHSLAASKLQSNLEYKRQSKEEHAHYNIRPDQPEFLHAKKSQAQASDLTYRHKLHDYTCDPEQLNVKHAKQAYKLQSDVSRDARATWIWKYNYCHLLMCHLFIYWYVFREEALLGAQKANILCISETYGMSQIQCLVLVTWWSWKNKHVYFNTDNCPME